MVLNLPPSKICDPIGLNQFGIVSHLFEHKTKCGIILSADAGGLFVQGKYNAYLVMQVSKVNSMPFVLFGTYK
jgi:hypothetical protein